MMNVGALRHFPDRGRCLGVLFEALGRAQEALTEHLHLQEEQSYPERNSRNAGTLARLLGRPEREIGEALFLHVECIWSKIIDHALQRIGSHLEQRPTVPAHGHIVGTHTDNQNLRPGSSYQRVMVVTWTVYLAAEGRNSPLRITGILCSRIVLNNR